MFCSKCGAKIKETDKFCPQCGYVTKEDETTKVNNTVVEEKRYVQSMQNDTFLCMLSLIFVYGSPIVAAILTGLGRAVQGLAGVFGILTGLLGLCPLAGYVLCIVAKVKYPESKFAKILLIVYIVQFVLGIILVIIFIVACAAMFRDCSGSGMGMILPFIFK